MLQKYKLSIVVPCYNEEKNIPLILERFSNVIKRHDIELLLVNNGSSDASQEVLDKLIPQYSFARSISIKVNQGYGFGICTGLSKCKGTYVGYTHADLQTDPADVVKALEILELSTSPETTYVKGDRKGRPFFDQFFTTGMSIFETMYLKTWLWDINAQPNLFHKSFFNELEERCPKDFSLDLYLLYQARKKGMELKRFDVTFPPRIHGQSSWNTGLAAKWKFIKRTFHFSLKLKRRLR